jgi:hypothetical protein
LIPIPSVLCTGLFSPESIYLVFVSGKVGSKIGKIAP